MKHINNVCRSEVKWGKPVHSWNTSLRFTAALWSASCLRRSEREGATCSGGQLWLRPRSPLALRCFFHSILGSGCSMVSRLIVILINGWQWLDSCPNTGSIVPAPLPSLSGTEGGLSMKLSSHSSVYTLQPFPDPVNVLSVSSHTPSLNNDPGVKSCTNKEPSPLPLNTLQRVGAPKEQKTYFLRLSWGLFLGTIFKKLSMWISSTNGTKKRVSFVGSTTLLTREHSKRRYIWWGQTIL